MSMSVVILSSRNVQDRSEFLLHPLLRQRRGALLRISTSRYRAMSKRPVGPYDRSEERRLRTVKVTKVGSEIDICANLLTSSSSRFLGSCDMISSSDCGWTRRWVFSRRILVENTTSNINISDNAGRDCMMSSAEYHGVQLKRVSPRNHTLPQGPTAPT